MSVFRRKIFAVTAKLETTEGTDATPALATDAVRLQQPGILKPAYVEDGKKTAAQHAGLGLIGREAPKGRYASIDLTFELRGKGSAYTGASDVVELDVFLQGAGLSKTFATNKLVYTTLDSGFKTFTLYCYGVDGMLSKLVGCVTKAVKLAYTPGQAALATVTVMGRLESDPAAYANLTGLVLPTVMPPVWADIANALAIGASWSTATAAPNQLVPRKLEVSIDGTEAMRPWAGANGLVGIALVDRQVSVSADVEAVAPTTFDPYARAKDDSAGTSTAVVAILGTAAGNIVTVTTGQWMLDPPQDTDLGGLAGWSLKGDIAARSIAAGDGAGRELAIVFS